jgi:hypothetical protein
MPKRRNATQSGHTVCRSSFLRQGSALARTDFWNIFAEKCGEKIGVLLKLLLVFA